MPRICEICGKRPLAGNAVSRRGRSQKRGGVGSRVVKRVRRIQLPNLQTVKTIIDGTPCKLRVCTKCLKAEKAKIKPK